MIKYKIPIDFAARLNSPSITEAMRLLPRISPFGEISHSEENPDFRPSALDHVFL